MPTRKGSSRKGVEVVPALVLGARRRCQFEVLLHGRRAMLLAVRCLYSQGETFVDIRLEECAAGVSPPTLRVEHQMEVIYLPARERAEKRRQKR